ncbi:methyltransferase [Dolichospermum sp. LEGE 00240]|uniref:methyltransferase n=1 Tax=Dolichospermum sp. LEGE 00240 TaxID=1828603 RepID=UPI001882481D|nr:methyltransferase [Dolichospermum sp. LEGE 00240]MBE9248419.1 methyltransferase [Dolichospermum sp. LEGE 00240]
MATSETQETASSSIIAFIKLINGSRILQAMNVAARLGIADLLKDGAKSIEDLSQASDSHAPSLYRVLRALASVGVFTEVEPCRFALTPISEYLQSDIPGSLRYLAIMHGEEWFWSGLAEMYRSVKEGKPGISYVYPVNSYWEYLVQNPEPKAICDRGMLDVTKNLYKSFIKSYDFSSFTKVVDIGGGTGNLISSILKANPHLQGILFDLPETVTEGAKFLEIEGLANRCETVGGDLLKSVPVGGDLYIVSFVLVDWDNSSCLKIIKNIRQAIVETGKLLIVDFIITPGDEYHQAKWVDIFELCMGNGRVHTETEYREIFEQAGFRWLRTLPTEAAASVIEVVPV